MEYKDVGRKIEKMDMVLEEGGMKKGEKMGVWGGKSGKWRGRLVGKDNVRFGYEWGGYGERVVVWGGKVVGVVGDGVGRSWSVGWGWEGRG